MSLPPDEEWVTVRYLPGSGTGQAQEARFDWQVFCPAGRESGGTALAGAARGVAPIPTWPDRP